jgi:hypothetical protein
LLYRNDRTNYTGGTLNELLFYQNEPGVTQDNHLFNVVKDNGGIFAIEEVVNFIDDDFVENFSIDESAFLVNDFNNDAIKDVLILDDQNDDGDPETAVFFLFDGLGGQTELTIDTNAEDLNFYNLFQIGDSTNRNERNNFLFFAGSFTSVTPPDQSTNQVLMVDRRQVPHKWYLGTLDLSFPEKIVFYTVMPNGDVNINASENPDFGPSNRAKIINVSGSLSDQIIFTTPNDGKTYFHRLKISGSSTVPEIQLVHHGYTSDEYSFKWEFNHNQNPLLQHSSGLKEMILSESSFNINQDILTGENYPVFEIERPDLLTKAYPFRWIQGDYNGDGKTDIGIFHLKESKWYFANTVGTVPDMMNRVYNGIGGRYDIDYINSSSLDNTGDDNIPDLPMNYKVCSQVEVSDGLGHYYKNRYEYKNGYAFSAFINDRKETDYFGFGEFKIIDGVGGKTVSTYNNVPYSDFLENRALAGAVKEKRTIGYDNIEYSREIYNYTVLHINTGGIQDSDSFLIQPTEVKKYIRNTLVQTTTNELILEENEYKLDKKIVTITDHYQDNVHNSETTKSETKFETNDTTNQQRIKWQENLTRTTYETRIYYDYDTWGNLIRQTLSYTGNGLSSVEERVTGFEYDNYGNKTVEEDKSGSPGRRTEYEYDSVLNQFISKQKSIGDSIDLITTNKYNYNKAFGQVIETADPNENKTYNSYDNYGRIKEIKTDTDDGMKTLSKYFYSSEFPLGAKTIQFTGTGKGDIETRVYTDGLGRHVHTIQSALEEDGKQFTKTGKTIYDALGRVIRQSQTGWAQDIEIDKFVSSHQEKYPTITEYDGSGRVKKITYTKAYPGEAKTSVINTYNDPWEVISYHSGGQGKRTIKNARDQILYIEDFGTGDDGIFINAKIGFCYDIAGNRIKKMDLNDTNKACKISSSFFQISGKDLSGHNIAVWKYDAFGQIRESNDPDFGYSTNSYNSFGEITSTFWRNNKHNGCARTNIEFSV